MNDKFLWKEHVKNLNNDEIHIEKTCLTGSFKVHSHDFTELVIILKGYAKHIINDQTFDIHAGNVYVLNGDTTHGFEEVHHLELVNIIFHTDTVIFTSHLKSIDSYRTIFEIEPLYRSNKNFDAFLTLNLPTLHEVEKIVTEMLTEYTSKNLGYQALLSSLLNQLVVRLCRSYYEMPDKNPKRLLQLSNVMNYIDNHYTEDIKISELAALSFFSQRQFNRIFKNIYGLTPLQYIQQLRLTYAKELLDTTSLNITQIALQCGFTDISYFINLFKKSFTVTPKQYRSHSSN